MGVSIKTKLTAIIFGFMLLLLAANLTLNYYSIRENLVSESEKNMNMAAMQIAVSVEQSGYSSDYVEQQMASSLYLAAVHAASELPPHIGDVSNEQLEDLAVRLDISGFSLLVRQGDDIVVSKSSDPRELGLSTREWGYWFTAFNDLLELRDVSVSQGQKREHFWSGPFEFSSSSPEAIHKWGYYYDGTTDYIIDSYIRSPSINEYVNMMSPRHVVEETMRVNPQILEMTGINPATFGLDTMDASGRDNVNTKLRNRPIKYGTYRYGNPEEDRQAVERVMDSGMPVTLDTSARGQRVLKSFIPIVQPDNSSYIISVVMDYSMISNIIKEQLINNLSISLVLLATFMVGSYLLAGLITRPIQAILRKVNDVARGKFNSPLAVGSRDELGQLAVRINAMTRHLQQHTSRLAQMLEENREVKEHLESVINATTDAIHTVDLDGKITSINRAFQQLYGWSEKEALGRRLDLVPEDERRVEEERLERLKRDERLPAVETTRFKRDGTRIEVSISTSIIRDKEGHAVAYVHVARDMTERNKMEELLRRSEKLTTVGQLAAGVAHEIRNPLTTMRGFLQLQKEKQMLVPLHVELMLSELERINLIVSEFLILAKPQAVHFELKDVGPIMRDVISLLDSHAHLFGISFDYEDSGEPALIHCEENQLKQVFINIVKNAIEAMPDGGKITVRHRIEGSHVVVIIRDEGQGVPEDILPMLGEPFFTSKETGTGLGLMVSQRIIQAHKGSFEIESKWTFGTTVIVKIPKAHEGNGANLPKGRSE